MIKEIKLGWEGQKVEDKEENICMVTTHIVGFVWHCI